MKTLLLSTSLALGLGMAATSAIGAPLSVNPGISVAPATSNVDCRTVERRVTRDGVTRITRERECDRYSRSDDDDDYRDRRDRDRRVYRERERRPGISFGFN